MTKSVDFYFDIGSPAAYLAWTQMPKLAADTGANVNYLPFLLGGVFKATGNQSPVMIPAKGRWLRNDLATWAAHYGLAPIKMPPSFPVNTLSFMRALVGVQASQGHDAFLRLGDALYKGMFEQGLDMADQLVVGSVLAKEGFDPMAILALTQDQAVKDRLAKNTEQAIAAGAFGAPSFVVNGKLFWGQDRLEFVKQALQTNA